MARTGAPRGRTGRRPGGPDTRAEILTAAQRTFAEAGFAGATVRAIAAAAGVDSALVHHYFGTKQGLFLAVIQVDLDPRSVVDRIASGPADEIGMRLAATVLGAWDSPTGTALVAALRAALADPSLARTVREFLLAEVVSRLLYAVGCPPAEMPLRASLVVAQMVGVLAARYVLGVPPLSTLSAAAVAAHIGPSLQRYLTGDLP